MDKQKLNKKLAEWAGIPKNIVINGSCPECGQPMELTQSLDACFKWLVPEIYKRDYYYELLQWNSGQHKAIISKRTIEWAVTASDVVAETPALALCLAIEKLIGEGGIK